MVKEDFRADLHCHSTCSDGTLTPQELVLEAVKVGLKGLSITDHDTIEAYDQALPLAQEKGLLLLPGVEFSTVHKGIEIHVLGYGYDVNSPILRRFCERHSRRRCRRIEMIQELLAKQGMEVEINSTAHSLGRPHIAVAMLAKGYVKSIEEAFNKYLGRGQSCYCSLHPVSVPETIEVLRQAGGKVILAHPHIIEGNVVLKEVMGMNFDGLEGYYNRIHNAREQPWIKLAKSRNWLVTGGSDMHGKVKPGIPLGCSWVGEEAFMFLYKHSQENNHAAS
jgi:3',5'-nucleoside bisphosphate phosphatase